MNSTANQSNEGVVAYCRTCGKPLSEGSKREVYGVVYCEDCLASHVMGTPNPAMGAMPAPGTPVAYIPSAPNPGLAFILGFIPGVGAMYNGQVAKGFVHVGIFALLVSVLSNGTGGLEPFFGLMLTGFIGYMVFDAYQTARALRFGQPVPDYLRILHTLNSAGLRSDVGQSYVAATRVATAPATAATASGAAGTTAAFVPGPAPIPVAVAVEPVPEQPERFPISAIALIVIGVFFLLSTMDVVSISARYFFPILLIALGVWMAVRRTITYSRSER